MPEFIEPGRNQEDLLNLDVSLEEDVQSELEEFIVFARLGLTEEADALYEEILRDCVHLFPVFAEVAAYYLDIDEPERLKQLIIDHEAKVDYLHTPDQARLVLSLKWATAALDPQDAQYLNSRDVLIAWWKVFVEHTIHEEMSSYRVQVGETLAYFVAKFSQDPVYIFTYGHRFANRLFSLDAYWEVARINTICSNQLSNDLVTKASVLDYLNNQDHSIITLEERMRSLGGSEPGIDLCDVKVRLAYIKAVQWREDKGILTNSLELPRLSASLARKAEFLKLQPQAALINRTSEVLQSLSDHLPTTFRRSRLASELSRSLDHSNTNAQEGKAAKEQTVRAKSSTTKSTSSHLKEQSNVRLTRLTGVIARFVLIPVSELPTRLQFVVQNLALLQVNLVDLHFEAAIQLLDREYELAKQCVASLIIVGWCVSLLGREQGSRNRVAAITQDIGRQTKTYRNMFIAVLADVRTSTWNLDRNSIQRDLWLSTAEAVVDTYRTEDLGWDAQFRRLHDEPLHARLEKLLQPSTYLKRDLVEFGLRFGLVRAELQGLNPKQIRLFRRAAEKWKMKTTNARRHHAAATIDQKKASNRGFEEPSRSIPQKVSRKPAWADRHLWAP